MRTKLKTKRQTGQTGPGPHPLANCICYGKGGRGNASYSKGGARYF
jgi:hypothetical protein